MPRSGYTKRRLALQDNAGRMNMRREKTGCAWLLHLRRGGVVSFAGRVNSVNIPGRYRCSDGAASGTAQDGIRREMDRDVKRDRQVSGAKQMWQNDGDGLNA
jgi:hypothetical protein